MFLVHDECVCPYYYFFGRGGSHCPRQPHSEEEDGEEERGERDALPAQRRRRRAGPRRAGVQPKGTSASHFLSRRLAAVYSGGRRRWRF